jgi:LysM repeat protein
MNNPNPFVPQGSLLEQSKRRSRMKLAVFCVLTIGIAGLTAMLIQGCKRETENTDNNTQEVDTNNFAADTNASSMVDTNPPPPVVTNVPTVVTPPPVEPAGTEYVVVKGDSFAKIAKKFGVSTKSVEDANPGIVPTKLKVGQKLSIPAATGGSAMSATANETTSTAAGSGEELYSVKSGDTLSRIAHSHGVTVKALESENNLSTTQIKVGQKLKIPAKAEAATPAPEPAPVAPAPVEPAPSNAAPGQ